MPIQFLVAGLPVYTVVKQNPDYQPIPPEGHYLQFVNAQGAQPDLMTCRRALLEILDSFENEEVQTRSLHVLAFHKNDVTRNRFINRIQPYHRLRFMDRAMLRVYGTDEFTAYLQDIFSQEIRWHSELSPTARSDALLLPEEYFRIEGPFASTWQKVRESNSPRDIEISARLLKWFEPLRIPGAYRDSFDRKFAYDGAEHGQPRYQMETWKLTWRIGKLQYDVSPLGGGPISLDVPGRGICRFPTHANISPHNVIFGPF